MLKVFVFFDDIKKVANQGRGGGDLQSGWIYRACFVDLQSYMLWHVAR